MDCIEISDQGRSLGADKHVAFVSDNHLANQITKQLGYGVSRPCKKTIVVFETIEEYNNSVKDDLIKKALTKLTDEERKALGY